MAEDMKIGEIREYNGKRHICTRGLGDCQGCSYQYKEAKFCEELNKHLGQCAVFPREDGENVVFVILAD